MAQNPKQEIANLNKTNYLLKEQNDLLKEKIKRLENNIIDLEIRNLIA